MQEWVSNNVQVRSSRQGHHVTCFATNPDGAHTLVHQSVPSQPSTSHTTSWHTLVTDAGPPVGALSTAWCPAFPFFPFFACDSSFHGMPSRDIAAQDLTIKSLELTVPCNNKHDQLEMLQRSKKVEKQLPASQASPDPNELVAEG